ncbi:AAEL010622-PA [Aedes aegypti]|uniref:AAEL010622-PA n=1 Tax=Aedes aegypti TaxID=7159 RepID=Q16SC3_AEDAE|nr:AAEL010622-PA [Aedes aegypti]
MTRIEKYNCYGCRKTAMGHCAAYGLRKQFNEPFNKRRIEDPATVWATRKISIKNDFKPRPWKHLPVTPTDLYPGSSITRTPSKI